MPPQLFIMTSKQCSQLSYGGTYADCTVVQLLTKVIPKITKKLHKAEKRVLLCMCLAISTPTNGNEVPVMRQSISS
jgi:hypothetical protein